MKTNNKRSLKIICAAVALLLVTLTTTGCAFRSDYDFPFQDIEWVEITKDEALKIWNKYDTKSLRYSHCTVYTDDVGSQQKWIGCNISGSDYDSAKANIWFTELPLTVPAKDLPLGATYYKTSNNSRLLRIKENPHNPQSGENFYSDKIYKEGWLVERIDYRSYTERTYFYIEY